MKILFDMINEEKKDVEQTVVNDGVSGINKHSTPVHGSSFGLASYLIAIAVFLLAALTFYLLS